MEQEAGPWLNLKPWLSPPDFTQDMPLSGRNTTDLQSTAGVRASEGRAWRASRGPSAGPRAAASGSLARVAIRGGTAEREGSVQLCSAFWEPRRWSDPPIALSRAAGIVEETHL